MDLSAGDRLTSLAQAFVLMLATASCCFAGDSVGVSQEWQDKVARIKWVAYSPPSANPPSGIEATVEAVRKDLSVLSDAKFTGLVTYAAFGMMGTEVPRIAKHLGFKGLIIGVWDPNDANELDTAAKAAKNPVVLGYCIGNEGLSKRYTLIELIAAMDSIRRSTGKPVTTSEEIDNYTDEEILHLGDWIFVNAHPYFHSQLETQSAVSWTIGAFKDISRRGQRFVMFKEVGLPTTGDPKGKLSQSTQRDYYLSLAATSVRFVYFEAFDQPWKNHLHIEPHWGLFTSDRKPKLLAEKLLSPAPPFYVYQDVDSPQNHFKPTGYMGDTGDIRIDEACERKPHSGQTCIRITYDAKGKGPSTVDYPPPAKWAGVYWQEPSNNWGKNANFSHRGFDLSSYRRLVFWARAEKDCRIEFKVGGIFAEHGDSLKYPRCKLAKLTTQWTEFEIDLRDADLSRIIGGFCWVATWERSPSGVTFYLDDVRFEEE